MKRLRHYRIPINKRDKLNLEFNTADNTYSTYSHEIEIVNISNSGIGIIGPFDFENNSQVEISLIYEDSTFQTTAFVTRTLQYDLEQGKFYIGFEFSDSDQYSIQKFLMDIISSMDTKRLRSLMVDMIQNEGMAVHDKDELEVSLSIITDIFKLFLKYSNSYKLIYLFAREVKRAIRADSFRFYTFENEYRDVSLFDFDAGVGSSSYIPVIGVVKELRDRRRVIRSKVTKGGKSDEFYSLFNTLFELNVESYIISPVFDHSGTMIGFIEFSNKYNHSIFNEDDVSDVSLFSTVMGLTLSMHIESETFEYAKKLKGIYDSGRLIGTSEENNYLNSCLKDYSKSSVPLLITGEYGTGKKLVANMIHENSERAKYGIGHINSHDIESLEDLMMTLNGDGQYVGFLELYSGGTICIKDINFLNFDCQEYIFKTFKDRFDIRLIATSTDNLEVLKHNEEIHLSLLDFLANDILRIPSLSERKEDISPLAHYFTYELCMQNSIAPKTISSDVMNFLMHYDWPGNISELKIALERLIIIGGDIKSLSYIKTKSLPIVDREIDSDLLYGVELGQDLFKDKDIISDDDFEELYFYFYVDQLLSGGQLELFEIVTFFDLSTENFYTKLYHAHEKAFSYFGENSKTIDRYLEKKVAA